MVIFGTGFFVAIGLIVAIGAQNAWVLSMSVRRIYPWSIAIVCFSVDALLMAIGVLSFAKIQQWLPSIIPWFTWMGIGMLLWLAFKAANRALFSSQGLRGVATSTSSFSRSSAIGTALIISLLNPHVYLDTVILIGSIGSASEQPWLFWLGAGSASVLWFSILAAIGPILSQWLSSARRWRIFDALIAFIMIWVAASLMLSL